MLGFMWFLLIEVLPIVLVFLYIAFSIGLACEVYKGRCYRDDNPDNCELIIEKLFYPAIKLGEWLKQPSSKNE